MRAGNVTVAIPTYDRGPVLTDTVAALLRQTPAAGEIVVIDQTAEHEPAVARRLAGWEALGFIRWLRRERPSVPAAMNHALVAARCPVVLFLDDDIIPAPGLIAAHAACYADPKVWAVAGQVLQPGESPSPARPAPAREGICKDLNFPFSGTEPCAVLNCMAGNLPEPPRPGPGDAAFHGLPAVPRGPDAPSPDPPVVDPRQAAGGAAWAGVGRPPRLPRPAPPCPCQSGGSHRMSLRFAAVISHPIQHYSPVFRELARVPGVAVKAFYCCDWGVKPTHDP